MISEADLDNWFSYHAPDEEDVAAYNAMRSAARIFANVVIENTPPCADQTVAVRKIREAVMAANLARACN